MRKSYLVLLIVLAMACAGCKGRKTFRLQGELQELQQAGMLLVVYDDPVGYTDTIYPHKDGKFTYVIQPDTLTLFRLVSEGGKSIPIFADKGWKVKIKGDFDHFVVDGDGPNKEYQDFRTGIASLKGDRRAEANQAEAFIREHPQSIVSAYLINDYFVQTDKPDANRINALIKPLAGSVKDSRILNVVLKSLPAGKEAESKYMNYFSCRDRKGKYLSINASENSYTLVNLWASWNQRSIVERDSLASILKKLPPKSLTILNISADLDKQAWLNTCKADDKQWVEACDFKGWDSQILKQNDINSLPANILIDKNRRIMGKNLYGDGLKETIQRLIQEEKNKNNKP